MSSTPAESAPDSGPAAPPKPTAGLRPAQTAALIVLAGLLGFLAAGLASLVSRLAWRPGPWVIPWGLALATAASISLVVLFRVGGRGAGFAAAGGWLVGLFYVFSPRTEGDYVIASDALGYGFLLLSVSGVLAAAAWGSV